MTLDDLFPRHPLQRKKRCHYMGDMVAILDVAEREDDILLNGIHVLDGYERRGHSTNAVKLLLAYAESKGKPVYGFIEPTGRRHMNVEQLKEWYSKNGFTVKGSELSFYPKSTYR